MGNQTSRQFAESYVRTLTNVVNKQLNSCAAGNQQVVSIQIVGSDTVEAKIGKVNLIASALADCAQKASVDVNLQTSIQTTIDSAVKQVKEALNFNPGSQTSENVVRTAVELANTVVNSMTNECRATNSQALAIGVIDSKNVKVGIDAVDFLANATAQCTQDLASVQTIINRVEQDFKLRTEQKQEVGPLLLIIVLVVVFMLVAGYQTGGTTRIVIIVFAMVIVAVLAGYLIYTLTRPAPKPDSKESESKSGSSVARSEANLNAALQACTDSKASDYVPEQGFYWTFDKTDEKKGPFIPPGQVVDGRIVPRTRTGGDPGRPQGWQPSVVRQNAERIGVAYDDRETDVDICERRDLARPGINDMVRKIRGQ